MAHTIRCSKSWPAIVATLPIAADLARNASGVVVTDHGSSWVRRVRADGIDIYLKTYEYGSWPARLRNLAKRTAPWFKSRAQREFEALRWLAEHRFPAPEPLALLEVRRFGFLVRALLATAAFPGQPANHLLPTLIPEHQRELAHALGRLVGDLHKLGFRDRNLDLRNLLVSRDGGSFRIAKIDSGRFVLRAPGTVADSLAHADWDRLLAQLPPHLAIIARAAGSR